MAMDPSLILLFVPALDRGLVEGGAMPWLHEATRRYPTAGLVPSFPCLPSVVLASTLSGQVPASHGIHMSQDLETSGRHTAEEKTQPERSLWITERIAGAELGLAADWARYAQPIRGQSVLTLTEGTELVRQGRLRCLLGAITSLHDAAVSEGPHTPFHLKAGSGLDSSLESLASSLPGSTTLLLVGAPGAAPVHRHLGAAVAGDLSRPGGVETIDPSPESIDGVLAWDAEGAVARLRLDPARAAETIDELLAIDGIERVLFGEGLGSWGATANDDELFVLTEPGVSFEQGQGVMGHPELEKCHSPLLVSIGPGENEAWPAEIHDYRVAPSVLQYLGLSCDDLPDRPLPL